MIENTTNPAAYRAIQNAHAERGAALREVFGWIFGSSR